MKQPQKLHQLKKLLQLLKVEKKYQKNYQFNMNIFEKFLNNISHKFPKGYPDMNNEHDVILLNNIIISL